MIYTLPYLRRIFVIYRGLIEHKIIRARTDRAADFIRPRRGERFKAFFSGSFLRIEPRQGNNYQGRVTLIRKSCYSRTSSALSCPRLLFSTKTNFILGPGRRHSTAFPSPPPPPFPPSSLPIISRQRFAGTAHPARSYRNSATSV